MHPCIHSLYMYKSIFFKKSAYYLDNKRVKLCIMGAVFSCQINPIKQWFSSILLTRQRSKTYSQQKCYHLDENEPKLSPVPAWCFKSISFFPTRENIKEGMYKIMALQYRLFKLFIYSTNTGCPQ